MKKGSNISFKNYLSIVLLIVTLIAIGLLYFSASLPIDTFLVLVVLLFGIDTVAIALLKSKSATKNVIGMLIAIIVLSIIIIGINYTLVVKYK